MRNWSPGKAGGGGGAAGFSNTHSIIYNGTDEQVSLGDVATLKFNANQSFSVGFRYKTTNAPLKDFFGHLTAVTLAGWKVQQSDSQFRFYVINVWATDAFRADFNVATSDDAWHSVVFSYDGSKDPTHVRMSVDGGAVGAGGAGVNTLTSDSILYAGTDFQIGNANSASNIAAKIDCVTVWDYTLTDLQMVEFDGLADPRDMSGVEPIHFWSSGEAGDDLESAGGVLDLIGGANGTAANMTNAGNKSTDVGT